MMQRRKNDEQSLHSLVIPQCHSVDPIVIYPQNETIPLLKIPHRHSRVHTSTRHSRSLPRKAHNTFVTFENSNARPHSPIPHTKRTIHRGCDKIHAIELECVRGSRVSLKTPNFLPSFYTRTARSYDPEMRTEKLRWMRFSLG